MNTIEEIKEEFNGVRDLMERAANGLAVYASMLEKCELDANKFSTVLTARKGPDIQGTAQINLLIKDICCFGAEVQRELNILHPCLAEAITGMEGLVAATEGLYKEWYVDVKI